MLKKITFYTLLLLLIACNKDDSDTPISNIKYRLYLPENYNMDIQYYSDKYFDKGTLETFTIDNDSYTPPIEGIWEGKRLQKDKETGYFIQVNINQVNSFSDELKLFVYVNDSIVIDSAIYTNTSKEIKLEGEIPKIF